MKHIHCLGFGLLVALSSTAALAESMTLHATLNGATEVPPVETAAKGTAQVMIDPAAKTVHWKIDYSGLSGPVVAAHIHGPAQPGTNAGPMISLTPSPSPMEGTANATDAQIADMEAGRTYINLHTAAHGPGEIRGYLSK
jgi:hypothetical protein